MKKSKIFCEVCEVISPAPSITKDFTIIKTIDMLKKESKICDSIDYIYVTERDGTLVGVFSIKEIFRYSPETKVSRIMISKVISVSSKTSSEQISDIAIKYGIKSVPITENGKLVGMISPKKLSHILHNSLRKDIFHFAGIHKSHLEYENTLQVPLLKSVTHRIPWLIIGLLGVIITAAVIGLFEGVLQNKIILVFFIPAVVYISGALGNQLQALFIRDLAVMGDKLKIHIYIIKQTSISILIALVISLITVIGIMTFWQDTQVANIIALSIFASIIITNFTSFAITYSLKKAGKDPAIGAGPFATMVSDSTSIIVYLLIASAML
jgi:magnesium transporter